MSYKNYIEYLQKIADVSTTIAMLQWDQQVTMPEGGVFVRMRQLATLAGMRHKLATAPELGKLLQTLQSDSNLSWEQKRNITLSQEDYETAKKYPTTFIEEIEKTTAEAYTIWEKAKKESSFALFAPILSKIIDLKRREIDFLGYSEHPYDVLLHQFEPRAKTRRIKEIFAVIAAAIVPLVKNTIKKQNLTAPFLASIAYNSAAQFAIARIIATQMGYSWKNGRIDRSAHPFTTSFSSNDVRITTWTKKNDILSCIFATMHETGHALYEQGLFPANYGLPSGEVRSLGIHESQSLLWERMVGRSLSFWQWALPVLQRFFPVHLKDITPKEWVQAINVIQPSLIRVNADEISYHLHIIIRFELEVALLTGELTVADLPAAWNAKYKEYFSLDVPDDAHGVLQDVHWSHGAFGYFPTYTLGTLYAAQFFASIRSALPTLDTDIAMGNFTSLLSWLRQKIHPFGRLYDPEDLCVKATGQPLNPQFFLDHVKDRYGFLN